MTDKSPLDQIKDIAVGSLKAPAAAAGSAIGMAKGAASAGLAAGGHVVEVVTSTAADAVSSLTGQRDSQAPEARSAQPEPHQEQEPVATETRTTSSEPVNVTEELGLDPSPIAKPKPKKAPAKKEPATKIDAAADPSAVDVTPADVAKVADKDLAASEQAVEPAPE